MVRRSAGAVVGVGRVLPDHLADVAVRERVVDEGALGTAELHVVALTADYASGRLRAAASSVTVLTRRG